MAGREQTRSAQLAMAVIGVGQMGARHVAVLSRMERVRLAAVADPDPRARHRSLGAFGGVREYEDWRVLIDDLAGVLDAVCVVVPSKDHAEVVLHALDAGLHVLVEKPIATTLEDALQMRAAASRTGQKLMVGHVERFNPAVAKVKELVDDGRLGRIYRVHATRVGPFPARVQDTGVAIDLASHDIDVMQHVLGRELEQVYAEGGSFLHASHEDLITCLLRFEGGVLGLLDANWLSPEKQRELVLLGEGGMIKASYLTQDVWFLESSEVPGEHSWDELALIRGDAEGSAMRFALRKVEPIRAELEAFVDCIANDTREPVDADDGMRALAVALALRESVVSGQIVRLTEKERHEPSPLSDTP
jgi:UDP-N-acetylglucosamine 3-dehydrogenase